MEATAEDLGDGTTEQSGVDFGEFLGTSSFSVMEVFPSSKAGSGKEFGGGRGGGEEDGEEEDDVRKRAPMGYR